MPHGSVTGNIVSSPTMFVGFGDDLAGDHAGIRRGKHQLRPAAGWTNSVPFGWNSWGVIRPKNINYADALAVSDFFRTNLEPRGFTNNRGYRLYQPRFVLDATSPVIELQSFVNHCHAGGQKAGVYWTPFVYWGTAAQGSNSLMTGSSTYYWSDAYLRTSSGGVQTVDGAIALDPTHPGTKELITYYIDYFTDFGFDYIKSDFLSHGALEGVHYDPSVTTGIQAYNQGMSNILSQINGRMFMSESIAPLFPYQYGHSRRIACDAETSLISNTEYTLNSVTYGWWLDDLYQFNDPDDLVFYGYGATTNENQSRLISGAVTGLFLGGDDVTTTNGQQAAQACLTNTGINTVARVGRTFTPVEGNTGTAAANVFVRQDGATWRIAVLNYTASTANETVNLSRVGLPSGNYIATNLWDGTTATVTGSFNVSLNAKQSKLFRLAVVAPANLAWSSSNNSGTWDTGISPNWINQANSLPTVFIAGDSVLFNDTPGEPTGVTVSGTVVPSGITVNSTNNAFTISSGTLSGSGGLVKEGPSALTITSAGSFTGPVTISGGSVYAGDNCFESVSGITVTNDATMDFGGSQIQGGQPVTVSGSGVKRRKVRFSIAIIITPLKH